MGTWQYDGGLYNGREQKASLDFQMQRTYTENTFEAYLLEGSAKPELYSSGLYEIKNDSLMITSKFSSRPSQNTDQTIIYNFVIDQNSLTIKGVLPNGMVVEHLIVKTNRKVLLFNFFILNLNNESFFYISAFPILRNKTTYYSHLGAKV
jgi:hypothetical protein